MKSKKSLKIKLIALFIITAMLIPMTFACGEKAEDNASKNETQDQITDPPTEAQTTTEAPPTEPPTTEEPTEPFVVDSSLSYWEQIESELAWYGLEGGVKILPGADEAELMKNFGTNNCKKEELDLSGEDVPFSSAYRVTVAKDTDNFWNSSYNRALEKDVPTEIDDMIVGVVWVRGVRLSETEKFMADDPAQYYLAVKTSTDNNATEGDMEPRGVQFAEEEWQKVFFCGRVLNEESKSQNMNLQIFIGYGNQQLDIGGIIAYKFPWTSDNEKAVWKVVS